MSNQNITQSNFGAPGADDTNSASQNFRTQYGEPNTNLGGINSNGSNPADSIPIDNSIQHYELPNLTQRKFPNCRSCLLALT